MTPFWTTAVLIVAESALLLLPLLPALEELRRKRDADPLEVIQKHSGEVGYFAHRFRQYIDPLIEPLRQSTEQGVAARGRMPNGEGYALLGYDCGASFREETELKDATCRLLVACGAALTLPNGVDFLKEIYAAKSLVGGEAGAYRAILGDGDIHLLGGSKILRWVHAGGQFRADCGCRLYGRVSSDQQILLQPGCTFQRLHAPRIALGCASHANTLPSHPHALRAGAPPETLLPRRLVEGDLEIRPGQEIEENIVARGKLHIGSGARILGSVKAHQSLVVDADVQVAGSLITSGALRIGPRCRIGGPVLAEQQIEIDSGSVCGRADSETTVSSLVVEAREGALFFGTLWARQEGRVLARE